MLLRPFCFSSLLLLVLAGAVTSPTGSAHGGEPEDEPVLEPVRYYVHNFTDPEIFEHGANRTPPAGETPQAETCLACAGDPQIEYNFTTDEETVQDTDVSIDTPGVFTFWIRAYQPADGAAPPPLDTRIRFNLFLSTGALFGEAEKTVSITTTNPTEFRATFDPLLAFIPAGVNLRWNVQITNPTAQGSAYNPVAAPYGVSEDYSFTFSFTRVVPEFGVSLQIRPLGEDVVRVNAGQSAIFNFTVENHGAQNSTVSLDVGALPEGSTGRLLSARGDTALQPFVVAPTGSVPFSLVVDALPVGNHTVRVEVSSTKGESGVVLFVAQVLAPLPVVAPQEPGGLPGFDTALLGCGSLLAFWMSRRSR